MNDRAMSSAVNLFLEAKQRIDYHIITLNSILRSKYILLFTFSLPTIVCVWKQTCVRKCHCMCVCTCGVSPKVEARNHLPSFVSSTLLIGAGSPGQTQHSPRRSDSLSSLPVSACLDWNYRQASMPA